MNLVYPKIPTVWNRDPQTNNRTLIEESWATPEIKYLCEDEWRFIELIDGVSCRLIYDGASLWARGRTDKDSLPGVLVSYLHEVLPRMKQHFPHATALRPAVVFGEGCGRGVRTSSGERADNYSPGKAELVVFDAVYGETYLEPPQVAEVANALGLPLAPQIHWGTLAEACKVAKGGFPSHYDGVTAEGLVMRPEVTLCDRLGARIMAKVRVRDFQVVSDAPELNADVPAADTDDIAPPEKVAKEEKP